MSPETFRQQKNADLDLDFHERRGDELEGALLAEVSGAGWKVEKYAQSDPATKEVMLTDWAKAHLKTFNDADWTRQERESQAAFTHRRLGLILEWLKNNQPTEPEPWDPSNPVHFRGPEYGNRIEKRLADLYYLILQKLKEYGLVSDEENELQLYTSLHSPADSLGVDFFLTLKTGGGELTLTCDVTNNEDKERSGADKIIKGYRFDDEQSITKLADEIAADLKMIKIRTDEAKRRQESQRPINRNITGSHRRHYNSRG